MTRLSYTAVVVTMLLAATITSAYAQSTSGNPKLSTDPTEREIQVEDEIEVLKRSTTDGEVQRLIEALEKRIDELNRGTIDLPSPVHFVADPPQEEGVDIQGVEVAGQGNIERVWVENRSSQSISFTPGDWLEPKYGSRQRMMVVRETSVAPGEIKEVVVACMQKQRKRPDLGLRFFSQTKNPTDPVQVCQRRCTGNSDDVQECIWGCEAV